MIIKDIILKNFRNYKNIKINLSEGFNFFIGDNGSGKTNIIEALSILSNIKSFRNISYSDMIKWGESYFYCKINLLNSNIENLSIGCMKESNKLKKKFKIDDCIINKLVDYYGKLLTIIYSPDDISIITGNPEIKRRYFDGVICKIDKNYFNNLYELKKIISNRNNLLKKIKNSKIKNYSQLDIWDELFTERVFYISKKRNEFIKEFSEYFTKEYNNISVNEKVIPDISLSFSLKGNSVKELYDELKKNINKDISFGTTGLGPHRDQYIFSANNINFKNIASQGQKRTAAFALKNSEKEYIEKKSEKKCILLIDDIFAELDESRRNNILIRVKGKNQVLFTMVSKELLKLDDIIYDLFYVNDGNINRV